LEEVFVYLKNEMMKLRTLATALLFTCTLNAQDSTDNIETDRPDQTETPTLTKKGYFQAELGLNYERVHESDYTMMAPTSLLKYGISKRFEFRLNVNYRTDYIHLIPNPVDLEGFEPIELGTKIALWEEKNARPKTSFIAHIGLSEVASKVYKPKEPIASLVLTMQHTLSKITSLGYNLGLKWEGESSAPLFVYTFAPGFNLSDRFYFFVESCGFIGKENYHDHNVDAGIAYLINKNMKMDFAAGKGLSKASSEYFLSIGFSFRVPVSKNAK
jgi:hypothetical protein